MIGGPGPFFIGEVVYRDLVFQNHEWNWRALNFDADVGAARERFADAVDALDPNLLPFAARGGKLIMYHGWSDPLIQAESSRRYYSSVADAVGGAEAAGDFARLFLMPGVAHCRGGSGPDTFDGLSALIDWVERGVPPDRLVAARMTPDGTVDRTRPLCPYPQLARWTGAGDTTTRRPSPALAVMQLVEQGLVDLNAPVVRYLPEFSVDDERAADIYSPPVALANGWNSAKHRSRRCPPPRTARARPHPGRALPQR